MLTVYKYGFTPPPAPKPPERPNVLLWAAVAVGAWYAYKAGWLSKLVDRLKSKVGGEGGGN